MRKLVEKQVVKNWVCKELRRTSRHKGDTIKEDARNQASQGQTGVSFVEALSGVVRRKAGKVGWD